MLAELREVRAEAVLGHGGYEPMSAFSYRLIAAACAT